MKVCIDAQVFLAQRRGGVSRYFTELIRAFRSCPDLDVEAVLPWRWAPNEHAVAAGVAHDLPVRSAKVFAAANLPYRRRGRSTDLLHHTFYAPKELRTREARVRVVTVYDMIPELMPELFPDGNPHLAKRDYVAAADLVLCISESTRRDLVICYGEPAGLVEVVHLGVDPSFRPRLPRLPGWPAAYLLFVGNRRRYKDFAVLAQAFADIASEQRDLMLVAVGGGGLSTDESDSLRRLGIDSRVVQRDLGDADLPRAYANAAAFVFASRYEGFGLPTLEAMASGCPTVLADSSSLPEVGGDAAAYFPPGDAAALAAQLRRLVTDPGVRAAMVTRGLDHAARFTWAETARRTAEAYHQVTVRS